MSYKKIIFLLLIILFSQLPLAGASENRRKDILENSFKGIYQGEAKEDRSIKDTASRKDDFNQLMDLYTGNINFFYGEKRLKDSDWFPIEKQKEYGIELDIKEKTWPLSLLFSYSISEDSAALATYRYGKTQEIQLGIKKIFELQHVRNRPFLSTGITYINAEQAVSSDNSDTLGENDGCNTAGVFVGGGCYFILWNEINLGFSLKYSKANALLFDEGKKAGGLHLGLLTGFHF